MYILLKLTNLVSVLLAVFKKILLKKKKSKLCKAFVISQEKEQTQLKLIVV